MWSEYSVVENRPGDSHQQSRIAITENPQAFFVVFEYSVVESFSDNLLILCG